MKKILMTVSFLALAMSASAMAGREVKCKIDPRAKTLHGIRSLHFTKEDSKGVGSLSIVRDGRGPEVFSASNSSQIYWGETSLRVESGNVRQEDTLYLEKSRDGKDRPSFALVKRRRTLTGEHCDGYHACRVEENVVESVAVKCVDSDDLPRKPRVEAPSVCTEPYHCDF